MDPSCSHSKCDIYEGTNNVPLESNSEDKTDIECLDKKSSTQDNGHQIDDLERADFEEENRIIKHVTGMFVDSKIAANQRYSGSLSSANSSLASSSETISHLPSDYSLPGCSKSLICEDSNTTIKNMIHSRKPYVEEPQKEDFMQKLLNSNPEEKKDFPKGKMYKAEPDLLENEAEGCEGRGGPSGRTSSNASSIGSSGSDSTKDFTVPSTSNAEKLLGLDDSSKNEPGSSKPSAYMGYCEADDDSEDDGNEEAWCTCLSSHEDDDDDDEPEPEPERLWRKRRYEPPPPQSAKKFCPEGPSSSNSQDSGWNLALNNANVQGPPEIKQWLNKFQSWTNNEKFQAIDALISRCGNSHVRYMMKSIEPLFQRDFISLLPKELALTVLGYLQPKDLLRAAQTCQYWRFLADDNLLWKEQCRRIGITTLKKMPRSLPRCASPWKAAYMRQYLIENNWLHKPVNNPIIMRGHDDHVITCLQFYGNRILSGSDDTTLKVWSAVTGKCLRTLVGHSGGVWSSQMVGDLVISGSTDRTLRVWNAKSGQCLKVLAGHTSTVRCMHLHQDRVVSGSRDATLRVWSVSEGRCVRVLVGHLAAVRCVQYDGKVVVSGAYDYFVKVWNPDTGECLHTLAGHTNRVYSLQFDGVHVVSGSLDTSIRVWDVESGQLKHMLTGHQSLTSGMELHSNILVSGNADSTVKVWDITTGHCLHTLSGPNKHQSAVTCLQSSNRFVITSSDDGTVKLWDLRTGEFIRNLVELSSGGSGGVVWRIRASATKLICAVGSRNGTEETKLLVLDFDVPGACRKCDE
ncbi:F-box/WD repeat-containing protein 7 [Amyelois transitella]|uniref:F-box/WD repeat-containing protein 7 n=1 Tax=Amyelois transitella TaxID=680683 RepID=UPI00067D09C0|nr:F-box/WD repeat-containing protein 7 [Amyelois transitella]XP_013184919.1 F-box/WD repeat-containing protein 7 [Amyelois transitella]XP_013184920.1 F-box/WD repeat-containing protein 7 [Amyelois transitella]XP_060809467.1 F-box/WD repeat-containing protein 7 [Amyelois transitella]